MMEMMGRNDPKLIWEVKINKNWNRIRNRTEETGVQNVQLYLSHILTQTVVPFPESWHSGQRSILGRNINSSSSL